MLRRWREKTDGKISLQYLSGAEGESLRDL